MMLVIKDGHFTRALVLEVLQINIGYQLGDILEMQEMILIN